MNLRNQIIYLLLLINVTPAFAQEGGLSTESRQPGWQEEFPDEPRIFGLQELEDPPTISTQEKAAHEWWKLFGYHELNDLITLAQEENYSLKIAQGQVNEAREEIKLARSGLFPDISLNTSFVRQEFSGNRPMPFEGPVDRIRYNTYSVPLDVTYEVDIVGKTRNRVEASEFNHQASTASREAASLEVASEVARHYVYLLVLDSEEEVLVNTRHSREENYQLVKTRYEAGLTNEIDLHRAQTELSSVEVQIKNLEIERREVELLLGTLVGMHAGAFSVEKTGLQYAVPEIQLIDTSSRVLSRPDLRAASLSVAAGEKQLKSARKNLYPSLYLSGSTGLVAADSEEVLDGDSRNWLLGATLAVPIFEGGRRHALLNISQHQLEQRVNYLKQEELRADQQVLQELSASKRLAQQLHAQQEFLLAAQRAAYLSQQRYLKGLVTYLEVVDAERIVLEAQRLSIQLIGKQLLNRVDLMKALGGDFTAVAISED